MLSEKFRIARIVLSNARCYAESSDPGKGGKNPIVPRPKIQSCLHLTHIKERKKERRKKEKKKKRRKKEKKVMWTKEKKTIK